MGPHGDAGLSLPTFGLDSPQFKDKVSELNMQKVYLMNQTCFIILLRLNTIISTDIDVTLSAFIQCCFFRQELSDLTEP